MQTYPPIPHAVYYLFLTTIGLTPGGSSTVTFTHKQYIEYRERNIHNTKNKQIWESQFFLWRSAQLCIEATL
jgi:hypothetical protein